MPDSASVDEILEKWAERLVRMGGTFKSKSTQPKSASEGIVHPAHLMKHQLFCQIPDSTCTTVLKNKCQFPYRDESGQLRYECFKSKNGVERFKSFCPTKIDPLTGILDRDSIEECHSHSCPLAKYHTHPELMRELNELTDMSSDFFENAELFDLGNSQLGAPLYGIRLMEGVSNINGSILAS